MIRLAFSAVVTAVPLAALAEELAHWVWFHYRPWVDPIEGWRDPDADHPVRWYWRDPDFEAWFNLVRAETRGICP